MLPKPVSTKPGLRSVVIVLVTIFAGLLLWHLLCGRLAPVTGIFLGTERIQTGRAIVRYHEDRRQAEEVLALADGLIPSVAQVTGLELTGRIEVVLCHSDSEYRRLTGSAARFVTLKDRVFVSARALLQTKRGDIHLRTYLAHELTHALVGQHQTWLTSWRFPAWLAEGLATFTAEQMGVDGYFDQAGVCSWLCGNRIVRPSEYTSHSSSAISLESLPTSDRWHFVYAEFAYFVADLVQREGKDRLLRYVTALNKGENATAAFVQEYSASPDERFDAFRLRFCAARAPTNSAHKPADNAVDAARAQ